MTKLLKIEMIPPTPNVEAYELFFIFEDDRTYSLVIHQDMNVLQIARRLMLMAEALLGFVL